MNADLRAIFRALREDDFDMEIVWILDDRRRSGDYTTVNGEQRRIRVDPWKEVAGTIVHEVMHLIDARTPHAQVVRCEDRIVRHASARQLKRLMGYAVARWLLTLEEHGKAHRCPFCARRLPRLAVVRTARPETPQTSPLVRAARKTRRKRR